MDKRDLKKIPDPEFNFGRFVQGRRNFYLHLTEAAGEQVLVAYMFDLPEGGAKLKVFLWAGSYTTQKKESGGYIWTGAGINHLADREYNAWLGCYSGWDTQVLNQEAIEGASHFLKSEGDIYWGIDKFQEKVRAERLERRDKKTTDRIDKAMGGVSGLPEDFDTWAVDEVLYYSRYVIYEYSKKKETKGFCTHCGDWVGVGTDRCRHNAMGICPSCNSEVTFKARGKTEAVIRGYKNAAAIQPYGGGFIIRYFQVSSSIYKDKAGNGEEGYKKLYIQEIARDIYPGGDEFGIREFEYTLFKQRVIRWCDSTGKYNYGDAVLYPFNVEDVLKDTDYRYSALGQMAAYQHAYSFNIKEFINQYPRSRHYEYLIKMGLCNIVKELVGKDHQQMGMMDAKGKGVTEVLGVEKYDIPILQKTQADLTGLGYVKYARGNGIKLQEDHIRFIQENYRGSIEDLTRFCNYTTIGRAIRYIRDKGKAHSRSGYRERTSLWGDYIDMAKKLKYDLKDGFVLFPENLRQAHDIAVRVINEEKNKERYKEENKKNAGVAKMEAKINQKYYFENEGYFIRAPHDAAEIVREGQSLHHCVASYTERVAAGKTTILFLREKEAPDTPYYTIEIKDGKIVQWHGKYNDAGKPKPKKVIEFVKQFEKERVNKKEKGRTA